MSDESFPTQPVINELVAAFEAVSEEVISPDGTVLLGEVSLRSLMLDHLDDEMRGCTSASEPLLAISDAESKVLDHYTPRRPGSPDWDWTLDAFRIGDRGYIAMIHEDDDDGPGQPIYGAWEPFDSQAAFEACFIAVYERYLEPILFGTHLWRGELVSKDLLERALWAGLNRADTFRWEQLREYALPLDTMAGRRAVLEYYLGHTPEP